MIDHTNNNERGKLAVAIALDDSLLVDGASDHHADAYSAIEYVSYSAHNADHPDWYIHEYAGGRRVLTSLNSITGEYSFVKEL